MLVLEDELDVNLCYDCFHFLRFTIDEDTGLGMCTHCQRHIPTTDSCENWKPRHEGISKEFKERKPWRESPLY